MRAAMQADNTHAELAQEGIFMDQMAKLLNCVAQNAQTGYQAIEKLLAKTSDPAFRDELLRQRQDYHAIRQDAESKLNAQGVQPEPKRPMDRVGAWMGMEMATLTDKSNAHLADLVIQGATMGVIETTKARNECADASADAQGVASCFITQQQDAIERMKGFLM